MFLIQYSVHIQWNFLVLHTVVGGRFKRLLSNIDEGDEGADDEEEQEHNTLLMVPTLLDATSIYSQQSAISSPKIKTPEDKEKASDTLDQVLA